MALPKSVKKYGSFYKGYQLVVLAAPGDYVLDMVMADKACAVNGITVIPDDYSAGDYFKIQHLDSADEELSLVGDTVFNVGKNAAWLFDFASLELLDAGSKLRLTYTSVLGVALNVYTCLERITTKTGGA